MASTTKIGGTTCVQKKNVSGVSSSVLSPKRTLSSATNSVSAPKTVTSKLTSTSKVQPSTSNQASSNVKVSKVNASEGRNITPEKVTKMLPTSPVSKIKDQPRPKAVAVSSSGRTPLSSPVKDTSTRSPVNVKQVGTIPSSTVQSSSLAKDTTMLKENGIASPKSKSIVSGATAVGGVRMGVTGVNKSMTKVAAKLSTPSSSTRTSSGTAITKTASSGGITRLENSPVKTPRTKMLSPPAKTASTTSPIKMGITALSPVKTAKTTISPVKSTIKSVSPVKTASSVLSAKTMKPTSSAALSKTNDLKDKTKLIVRRRSEETVKKPANILKTNRSDVSASSEVKTVTKQIPGECIPEGQTDPVPKDLDTLVELEMVSNEPANTNEEKCFPTEDFANAVVTPAPVVAISTSQDTCLSADHMVSVFEDSYLSTASSFVTVNKLEDAGVTVESSSSSVSVLTLTNQVNNDSGATEEGSDITISQIAPIIAEEKLTQSANTISLSRTQLEKISTNHSSVQIYPVCGQSRSVMSAGLSYADVLKYQVSNVFQSSSKTNTTKVEYTTSIAYENDFANDKKVILDSDFPILKGDSSFMNRILNPDVVPTVAFSRKKTNENGHSLAISNSVSTTANKVDQTKNSRCSQDDKDEYLSDDYYDHYGLNENRKLFDCKQNSYDKKVNNRKRMKRYMKKFEKKILGETITATCEVEASIFIAPVWKNIYSSCIANTD